MIGTEPARESGDNDPAETFKLKIDREVLNRREPPRTVHLGDRPMCQAWNDHHLLRPPAGDNA